MTKMLTCLTNLVLNTEDTQPTHKTVRETHARQSFGLRSYEITNTSLVAAFYLNTWKNAQQI